MIIDEGLLNQLSTEDKQVFLSTLDMLINQTYEAEREYIQMKASYESMQRVLVEIIEFLPTAIWVLDETGAIFLENTHAKNLGIDFKTFRNNGEVEIDESSYLIKTSKLGAKTIVQATDITEQKRTQRLVSMGQMAAHLAHEIRNPVGSVAILASTLYPMVPEKIKPMVEGIKKSIWRVERIIKATLLFTKGVAIKKTPLRASQISTELASSVEHYSYQKEIEFDFDLPDVEIMGDLELLSMVFQNLLFNAIDAIEDAKEESGKIELTYRQTDSTHIFCLYDSGAPISDKSILFDPFKTTKTKGNGLGLALSQQIAKAHGGEIYLAKDKKGFCLSIAK